MSEILQIKNGVGHVNDVTGLQHHTYTPYTTSFKNNDEIRIVVQSQDLYVQPSESYLVIELKPSKPVNNDSDVDSLKFVSSALYLFSEMRYELNGIEIDRCKDPATTFLLKHMLACKLSDVADLQGLSWLTNVKIENNAYRMFVPLKFVFGFCDDYTKIVANSKHELILVRSRLDTNAYIAKDDSFQFDIMKVQWKIPHVTLSDHVKLNMLRSIERHEKIPLAYRSWDLYEMPAVPQSTRNNWTVKTTTQVTKPRYVVVAFQTNRNYVASEDPRIFDHCNITNIRLYLNNERYPYDDMNLGYNKGDSAEIYMMLNNIQNKYYNGTQPLNSVSSIGKLREGSVIIYPFDCSRSDDGVYSNGMVDIRIEMESSENIPADTTAYCLIVHDNIIHYTPATGIVTRNI